MTTNAQKAIKIVIFAKAKVDRDYLRGQLSPNQQLSFVL